jgi:DNA-binding NtrC family response regulator
MESSGRQPVHILMVDVHSLGIPVTDALEDAQRIWPAAARILTGPDDRAGESVNLIRAGAQEVVPKPLDGNLLRLVTERALAFSRVVSEVRELRGRLRERGGYESIVGHSRGAERLRERVRSLAEQDGSILITGEEGVGKELAARILHALSDRAGKPFGALNCSAFREDALDRELLGSPGSEDAPGDGGLLESRDGGVLFLDDVDALPPRLQERLAAALEAGTVVRGQRAGSPVDVRTISASTVDLERAVKEGRFREDLYARIAGSSLHVEPLRERSEDVPVLARYFVHTICELNNLPMIDLTADALSLLEEHSWPGNARELRNAMEHATILATDGVVRPRDLPDRIRETARDRRDPDQAATESAFRDAKRAVVEEFERQYLRELLEKNRGNVTAAAQQAGMLRSALQRLLRKHSLRSADFRRSRRGSQPSDEA